MSQVYEEKKKNGRQEKVGNISKVIIKRGTVKIREREGRERRVLPAGALLT